MTRAAVLFAALAACGSKDAATTAGSGSGAGSAAAPAGPVLALVGCKSAREPFAISHGPLGGGTGDIIGGPVAVRQLKKQSKIRVEIKAVHAVGGIDPAILDRHLKTGVPAFEKCHTGNLAGLVELKLSFDASGTPTATASGLDPAIATCVADAAQKLDYPKDRGRALASARIRFTYRAEAHGFGFGDYVLADPSPKSKSKSKPKPKLRVAEVKMTPELTAKLDQALTGLGKVNGGEAMTLPAQWTPFARVLPVNDAPDDASIDAAVAKSASEKLGEIEKCFTSPALTGSFRAVITLGGDTAVRAGGLGDAKVEKCIGDALRGAHYAAPPHPHEVACDFTRGAAAAWRVTPEQGYAVGEGTVALVVADPGMAGDDLAKAVDASATSPLTLVAVRGDGGSVLAGVAPAADAMFHSPLELSAGDDGAIHACLKGVELASANIADAEKAWCKTPCDLRVVVAGALGAKQLVDLAREARAAGVDVLGIARERECGQ